MLALGALVLMSACRPAAVNGAAGNTSSGAERFASLYTKVSMNNIFVSVPEEQLLKIFEKGNGVVFLGFPGCPWCQAYAPLLEKTAEANGIGEIYYYDIKEDRESSSDVYRKLVEYIKAYLNLDNNNNERIYVPDVYVIKKGEIVGHDNETAVIENTVKPEVYWTNARKDALADKLGGYFKALTADKGCDECG